MGSIDYLHLLSGTLAVVTLIVEVYHFVKKAGRKSIISKFYSSNAKSIMIFALTLVVIAYTFTPETLGYSWIPDNIKEIIYNENENVTVLSFPANRIYQDYEEEFDTIHESIGNFWMDSRADSMTGQAEKISAYIISTPPVVPGQTSNHALRLDYKKPDARTYGLQFSSRPGRNTLFNAMAAKNLTFYYKSNTSQKLLLRIQDEDYEIWCSHKRQNYEIGVQIDVTEDHWRKASFPLSSFSDKGVDNKFREDGNAYGGNNEIDLSGIRFITFQLCFPSSSDSSYLVIDNIGFE